MFHLLAHYFKPYARLKMLKDAKRVLIVTSHPDDETMFFGPTILSLCRGKSSGHQHVSGIERLGKRRSASYPVSLCERWAKLVLEQLAKRDTC